MAQTAAQITQVDELESRVDELLREVDSAAERVTRRLSDEAPSTEPAAVAEPEPSNVAPVAQDSAAAPDSIPGAGDPTPAPALEDPLPTVPASVQPEIDPLEAAVDEAVREAQLLADA